MSRNHLLFAPPFLGLGEGFASDYAKGKKQGHSASPLLEPGKLFIYQVQLHPIGVRLQGGGEAMAEGQSAARAEVMREERSL